MVRLTGAALGFFAFAVTVFLGLSAGNSFEAIINRAMQALFTFFALGLVVGWVANRVVDEHVIKEHRELFPDDYATESEAGAQPETEPEPAAAR